MAIVDSKDRRVLVAKGLGLRCGVSPACQCRDEVDGGCGVDSLRGDDGLSASCLHPVRHGCGYWGMAPEYVRMVSVSVSADGDVAACCCAALAAIAVDGAA